MKKFLFMLAAAMVAVLPSAARDKVSRNVSDLPQAAQTMIRENFPKAKISHIKIDSPFMGSKEYDVVLNNGTEIEFDSKGAWKDVDCGTAPVPSALVPAKVAAYVASNHPGQKIVKIDSDHNRWEIELGSGLDIVFDKNGNFTRYDD